MANQQTTSDLVPSSQLQSLTEQVQSLTEQVQSLTQQMTRLDTLSADRHLQLEERLAQQGLQLQNQIAELSAKRRRRSKRSNKPSRRVTFKEQQLVTVFLLE